MATDSCFWVWFQESKRWIRATPEGAAACFFEGGCEVAWGVDKPRRTGTPPSEFPPLFRLHRWNRLLILINQKRDDRHRLGSIFPV